MQKRGQIKSLWAVIGAVFALIIIVLFTYVIMLFVGEFAGPSPSEQAATNNFDVLGKNIKKLIEHPGIFGIEGMQLNVPDGYILVGFDKDWHGDSSVNTDSENPEKGRIEANWCSDGEGIAKPTNCLGQACLCLFKETGVGDDFMEEGRNPDDILIPCINLGKRNIVISGPRDSKTTFWGYETDALNHGAKKYPHPNYGPAGSKYEFLVIYGKCDNIAWGIKPLYIEKYIGLDEPDKIYIFIANKSEEIQNREKGMKDFMATKLLNHAKQMLDNNEANTSFLIYKEIVDLYPDTGFASESKNQIKKICDLDPKPKECENINATYLP